MKSFHELYVSQGWLQRSDYSHIQSVITSYGPAAFDWTLGVCKQVDTASTCSLCRRKPVFFIRRRGTQDVPQRFVCVNKNGPKNGAATAMYMILAGRAAELIGMDLLAPVPILASSFSVPGPVLLCHAPSPEKDPNDRNNKAADREDHAATAAAAAAATTTAATAATLLVPIKSVFLQELHKLRQQLPITEVGRRILTTLPPHSTRKDPAEFLYYSERSERAVRRLGCYIMLASPTKIAARLFPALRSLQSEVVNDPHRRRDNYNFWKYMEYVLKAISTRFEMALVRLPPQSGVCLCARYKCARAVLALTGKPVVSLHNQHHHTVILKICLGCQRPTNLSNNTHKLFLHNNTNQELCKCAASPYFINVFLYGPLPGQYCCWIYKQKYIDVCSYHHNCVSVHTTFVGLKGLQNYDKKSGVTYKCQTAPDCSELGYHEDECLGCRLRRMCPRRCYYK